MESPRQILQGYREGLQRNPGPREVDRAKAEGIAGVKEEVTIVNGVLHRVPPGAGMETPGVDEESQIRAVNAGGVPRRPEEALQGPVNGMKDLDGRTVLREDENQNPEKHPQAPMVRNREARIEVEALGRVLNEALEQPNPLLVRGLHGRRRKRRT
jgi:hypothetical protein